MATIAVIACSVSSCKVEEEEGNKNLLVGTWELTQVDTCATGFYKYITSATAVDYYQQGDAVSVEEQGGFVTFNSNGSYKYSGNLAGSGSWEYQYIELPKNLSVLKLDNDPYQMMEVTKLNAKTLVVMCDYHFDKKSKLTVPTIKKTWTKK